MSLNLAICSAQSCLVAHQGQPKKDLFSLRVTQDMMTLIAPQLTHLERARLATVSKLARANIVYANSITLDVPFPPTMAFKNLLLGYQQYPKLNTIRIAMHYLTAVFTKPLIEIFKNRPMRSVDFLGCTYVSLGAFHTFIQQVQFVPLTHLLMSESGDWQQPESPFNPSLDARLLVPLQLRKETLDLLMQKDLSALLVVDLDLRKLTPEIAYELLERLPLERMTHITFQGQSVDAENLEYMASRLQNNRELELFSVLARDLNLKMATILNFISSIHSPALIRIEICSNSKEAPFKTEEIGALIPKKIASWPKMSAIRIDQYSFERKFSVPIPKAAKAQQVAQLPMPLQVQQKASPSADSCCIIT